MGAKFGWMECVRNAPNTTILTKKGSAVRSSLNANNSIDKLAYARAATKAMNSIMEYVWSSIWRHRSTEGAAGGKMAYAASAQSAGILALTTCAIRWTISVNNGKTAENANNVIKGI